MPNEPSAGALVTGLFETHLNVADLARSMDFYENVLGLELGTTDPGRRVALYWIGGRGRAMLGLWEKPRDQVLRQHFAFELEFGNLARAAAAVQRRGVALRDFFERPTDVPTVFGWMPAASIYFEDPDGHLLECLAMLEGEPRPELGIVSLEEWRRVTGWRE